MLNQTRLVLGIIAALLLVMPAIAQAPPCPGHNTENNDNLACEIATAVRASTQASQTLNLLSPTIAAQLSQLPAITAASGSSLTFSRSLGVVTASSESLGTILTQRGETLGKHKFFASFSYQRFGFGSIDGIRLKDLETVNQIPFGADNVFVRSDNRISLMIDQFTAIGSLGLTDRIDVAVLIPFAKVTLKTGSTSTEYDIDASGGLIRPPASSSRFLAGSANGIGDFSLNVKANVLKQERSSIAVGTEVRFPTGDETNYLGTGAYGVKPYLVFSRRGRLTPNVNIGYQWNGVSALFVDPTTGAHQNLPASFFYSGGLDFKAHRRLTLTAEFLGQCVINGPRLVSTSVTIPGQGAANSVAPQTGTYAMDNFGAGFKVNPFGGLLITANALIKLDDGGLRSKVVPLVGVSYRF